MTDRESCSLYTTGDDSTDALTDDHTAHTEKPPSGSCRHEQRCLTAFTDGGDC